MAKVAFGWDNLGPGWTPDGRQITFMSNRSGVLNLYQMAADGSGEAEHLSPTDQRQSSPSWSPDGSALAFAENNDLWWLSMDGERQRKPFWQTEFREANPTFSPNGRWLAYASDDSGQFEVFIRPFPPSPGKSQVSTEGGSQPRWNTNGDEIFYRNGDAMMAVDVVEAAKRHA